MLLLLLLLLIIIIMIIIIIIMIMMQILMLMTVVSVAASFLVEGQALLLDEGDELLRRVLGPVEPKVRCLF